MSEVRTEPVRAILVDDIDADGVAPGSYEFYRTSESDSAGIFYICPCGCKRQGALPFKPEPSPSWTWDGNADAPTLTPSVHHVGHWHGWLQNGVWTSC